MKFCQARLSPPLIGQIVAEASLDAPEEYYRDVYDEYVERRKCLIDGLNRIPGVYSPIPMGAFYTDTALAVTLGNGVDEDGVLLYALQVHGTDVRATGVDVFTIYLI